MGVSIEISVAYAVKFSHMDRWQNDSDEARNERNGIKEPIWK